MPVRSARFAALAPVGLFAVACITLATFGQSGQPERGQPEGGRPPAPPVGERQPGAGPREGAANSRGERPEPRNVEGCMKAINRGMRALKDQLKPETKDQALQTIWMVEKYALAAKALEPEHMKGGTTPETLAGYRKGQIELMGRLLKLEGQVMDGKMDDAKETFAAIGKFKKEAHEQFQVEQDEEEGRPRR